MTCPLVASPSAQGLQGHGPLDGSALQRLVDDPLPSTAQHVQQHVAIDPHFRVCEMAFAGRLIGDRSGMGFVASRLGERPEPQVDDAVSREESGKLVGQVGVSSEQLIAIERAACGECFEVGGDDLVDLVFMVARQNRVCGRPRLGCTEEPLPEHLDSAPE